MAIIPWLKGLEATIKVDGEPAHEYDPPEPESASEDMKFHKLDRHLQQGDPFVVKYIEVKPGAPFSFHVKRSPEFEYHGGFQIGFTTEVDGLHIKGIQTETNAGNTIHHLLTKHLQQTGRTEGSHSVGWVKRPFRFSTLNIVEDGVLAKEIKEQILQAQNLGYLRVYCYRLGQATPTRQDSYYYAADPNLEATLSMSEKALKGRALDCRVGLGEALPSVGFSRYSNHFEDNERRPFAVFEFRYRSLEGLYKEGIIPRPEVNADPSPVPEADAALAGEVDAFAIPEAEARQMLQRLLASRKDSPRIKPENPSGGRRDDPIVVDEIPRIKPEPSLGVKRERSNTMETEAAFLARYKGRKLRNGRIEVDLTGD